MAQENPTQFDFNIEDFKKSEESTSPAVEHTNETEIQADLLSFDQRTEQLALSPSEFEKFLDEVESNPTPENIAKLRQANKNREENAANPLEKHAKLASRFTKKVEVRVEGRLQKAYRIDFTNRTIAEGNIGLGDIMPPNLETVAVYDSNGKLISDKAVRRINGKNRIGYYDYDSGSYVPVYNNYFTVPLGTRADTKKDFTLAKRKLQEEVTLFNLPQDTRREEKQEDLNTAPAAIERNKSAHGVPIETTPASGEKISASRGELKKMGYKAVRRVTPAVRKKAVEILHKGNKLGTTTIIEVDGKKYAFRDEIHPPHKPGEKGPKKPHHGVSVLEYRA